MPGLPVRRLALASAFVLACLSLADAQENRSKLAITDVRQADEDFAYQGEYVGTLRTGLGGSARQTGLQVAALGDGEFRGVEYPGGLPGAGWNRLERIELSGRREGRILRLEGWPIVVEIAPPFATVWNSAGEILGELHKTHRVSYTMGYLPPPGGRMLFHNGAGTENFRNARVTPEGYLEKGADFRQTYRDYNLHVEFQLPYMPYARGQGRANSGVYLQSRYEVQILDSFALQGAKNECGALYRYKRPDVNMCFPPLSWQTYDIQFTSPRFDERGQKVQNARITVWHNGVLIHNDFEIERKTGGGKQEGPELFPIRLQDHGNPVRFRNIWIRENNVSAPSLAATPVPIATPEILYSGILYSPGIGWPAQSPVPRWNPVLVAVPLSSATQPGWYQGSGSVHGRYLPSW